jgi:DNA-binding MarR family transcriptional regulator
MARVEQDWVDRHVAQWAHELDWLDPVDEAIVARLMYVSRHLSANREAALAENQLPRASFKVLLALRGTGAPYVASPSEIADRLGLTRGALSSRLAPLENDGLITRETDRDDRRRVHVRLTAEGHRAFEAHARREERGEAAMLDALSIPQRRQLASLLRQLVLAIGRAQGDPSR